MTGIPTLYRGDSDPEGIRKLKREVFPCGTAYATLQTNLCNGGDGRALRNKGLKQAATQHCKGAWARTHFLSFSEDRTMAQMFMLGADAKRAPVPNPTRVYSSSAVVRGVILVFDPKTMKVAAVASLPGFHVCQCRRPNGTGAGTVVLIDVQTAAPRCGIDAPYAEDEKEWLVLPFEPFTGENAQPGELTGMIDVGFVQVERYAW